MDITSIIFVSVIMLLMVLYVVYRFIKLSRKTFDDNGIEEENSNELSKPLIPRWVRKTVVCILFILSFVSMLNAEKNLSYEYRLEYNNAESNVFLAYFIHTVVCIVAYIVTPFIIVSKGRKTMTKKRAHRISLILMFAGIAATTLSSSITTTLIGLGVKNGFLKWWIICDTILIDAISNERGIKC